MVVLPILRSDEVASPIALGGTARGKIDPETDVDYFRIDIDRPGALQATLSGVEEVDLTLELRNMQTRRPIKQSILILRSRCPNYLDPSFTK